ncbi:MAG: cytochrome ubiquinol oxidase subunit I [Myxococcales bacterium]|nr:cytochrome ubiquinol oxidase subunit I [Myxococcales bacterium]
MDVLFLSRLQFALTVMFHYLFPPLSIGLGLILVILEGRYLRTRDPSYERAARFWTKIFAVNFAVGVATGLVMEFEFGTNWATYSRYVGDVFGSALASEGIFAFFLESGFLAVLVFGWDRVKPRTHFLSTVMVFLGSTFSAVWIVVANSWMHTPAGYHIVGEGLRARAEITDFWAMVFNPSSMHRLGHVLLGSFLQGAFFVLSISAYYLLKRRHLEVARKSLNVALAVATLSSLAMLVSGHEQARALAHNQPAKLAAFEGHFETGDGGTGLYLFGLPNPQTKQVEYGVQVPKLLSVLVYGDPDRPVPGLDKIPADEQPPIGIPFQTYHVMISIGMYLIGLSLLSVFFALRKRIEQTTWLLKLLVVSVVAPIIANQAGWVATEVGRQPWIVQGLLKTSDALSKTVQAEQVLASILLFGFVYVGLFAVWVFVLHSKIQHGPAADGDGGGDAGFLEVAGERVAREPDTSLTSAPSVRMPSATSMEEEAK